MFVHINLKIYFLKLHYAAYSIGSIGEDQRQPSQMSLHWSTSILLSWTWWPCKGVLVRNELFWGEVQTLGVDRELRNRATVQAKCKPCSTYHCIVLLTAEGCLFSTQEIFASAFSTILTFDMTFQECMRTFDEPDCSFPYIPCDHSFMSYHMSAEWQ